MDVMIDIETLGTTPDAPILTIGAMLFDRRRPPPEVDVTKSECFYKRIELEKHVTVEASTMLWWMQQDANSKYEAFDAPDRIPLRDALEQFVRWCKFNKVKYVWSHGASFDCVIMTWHMLNNGIQVPWSYWNIRDTRTLYELADIRITDLPNTHKHHALYDCHRQIVGVNMSYAKLKN